MPLTHQGDDNVVAAVPRAGLRPVREDGTHETFRPHQATMQTVEHETTPDVVKHRPDPALLADKKVQRAIARVETLRTAQASAQVIARAEARVRDAEMDVIERNAARLNKQRQKSLDEARAQQHERISREHIQRLAGFAQVAILIGKVCVTIKTDRSMSGTARQFALTDVTRAIHVQTIESEKLVSLALKGITPGDQDTEHLLRVLKYECRRSIATGDTVISEM